MNRRPFARLIATGILVAAGSAGFIAPASAAPAPPLIRLLATADGHLHGMPRSIHAGRVTLSLTDHAAQGADLALLKLHRGYTLTQLVHDFNIVGADATSNARKASSIRRINRGVNAFATPAPGLNRTMSATFTLYAGTYYWFNAAASKLTTAAIHRMSVYGTPPQRAFPAIAGVIAARQTSQGMRWNAPAALPHAGRILFRNDTDELHFLYWQQVKAGTTNSDIQHAAEAFQAGQPPANNPFLATAEGTDLLSPGNQVVITYNLPPGTYDLECFVPDDQTGLPHIVMGMHKIVILK